MKQSFAIMMALSAVLVFSSVASAGLMPAEVGDPLIPDLCYDPSNGEVFLDVDGSPGIIGYVLKNGTNSFIPGNHTQILAGVVTSVTSEVSEAAFASVGAGLNSIGLVFPAGLNLAGLTALLTVNNASTSLGAPVVPFDLHIITGGGTDVVTPEPATFAMAAMGLLGMGLYTWRRRRSC